MFKRLVFLIFLIVLESGCEVRQSSQTSSSTSEPKASVLQGARDSISRFAFAAKVIDAFTHAPIKMFSVAIISGDPSLSTIVNSQGDRNGMFFVSRDASARPVLSPLTLLIAAEGYGSLMRSIQVGADCVTSVCNGRYPLILELIPGPNSSPNVALETPVTFGAATRLADAKKIAEKLTRQGKFEGGALRLVQTRKTTTALVLVDSRSNSIAFASVQSLIDAIHGDELSKFSGSTENFGRVALPWILASNPALRDALAAIRPTLLYLQPLLDRLALQTNQSLPKFLGMAIGSDSMFTTADSQSILASVGLGTRFPRILDHVDPLDELFPTALRKIDLLQEPTTIGRKADPNWDFVGKYLQQLIQGLNGRNGDQLGVLFNTLLRRNGLAGLVQFPRNSEDINEFGPLCPYLEDISRGLRSGDRHELETILEPIIQSKNPATVLRQMLDPQSPSFLNVLPEVFPGLLVFRDHGLPGKQVFATQLLLGLLSRNISAFRVIEDFPGSPAVRVSGTGDVLTRIAELPNVEKVIFLDPKQ